MIVKGLHLPPGQQTVVSALAPTWHQKPVGQEFLIKALQYIGVLMDAPAEWYLGAADEEHTSLGPERQGPPRAPDICMAKILTQASNNTVLHSQKIVRVPAFSTIRESNTGPGYDVEMPSCHDCYSIPDCGWHLAGELLAWTADTGSSTVPNMAPVLGWTDVRISCCAVDLLAIR